MAGEKIFGYDPNEVLPTARFFSTLENFRRRGSYEWRWTGDTDSRFKNLWIERVSVNYYGEAAYLSLFSQRGRYCESWRIEEPHPHALSFNIRWLTIPGSLLADREIEPIHLDERKGVEFFARAFFRLNGTVISSAQETTLNNPANSPIRRLSDLVIEGSGRHSPRLTRFYSVEDAIKVIMRMKQVVATAQPT